jgi:hypothetical protein
MKKKQWKIIKFIVRIGISCVLLFLLLRGSRFASLLQAYKSIHALSLMVSVLLFFTAQIFSSLKWYIFVGNISLSQLYKWTIIAHFYSMLLIGQVSGDVVRIFKLHKAGEKRGSWIALTFYDRYSGLISLLILSFFGVLFSQFNVKLPAVLLQISFFAMVASIVGAIGFVLFLRWLHNNDFEQVSGRRLKKWIVWAGFFEERYKDWKKWILFFLFAFFYQISGVVIITIVAHSILPEVTFVEWSWIIGLTAVFVMLPLSIGGLGIREAGFVGALYLLNVSREQAIALSLIIYSIQMTGAITGGILDMTTGKGNIKKMENNNRNQANDSSHTIDNSHN